MRWSSVRQPTLPPSLPARRELTWIAIRSSFPALHLPDVAIDLREIKQQPFQLFVIDVLLDGRLLLFQRVDLVLERESIVIELLDARITRCALPRRRARIEEKPARKHPVPGGS